MGSSAITVSVKLEVELADRSRNVSVIWDLFRCNLKFFLYIQLMVITTLTDLRIDTMASVEMKKTWDAK